MPKEAFGEVTERLRRSTVHLQSGTRGSGSGVIWSPDGLIITNAHVLRAGTPTVELWDGRKYPSRVLKQDRDRDLASLQIDSPGSGSAPFPSAAHGDSSALRPGELVIAVGNPMGFVGAVSTGVVHRVGPAGDLPVRFADSQLWVVTDARLAPGNSGGPLANARGEVIGINAMIAGGLGFAVPSNSVSLFLAAPEKEQFGLGVVVHPAWLNGGRGNVGFVVLEVVAGSSAERASLSQGDVLVGAGGSRFRSPEDLERAIQGSRNGVLSIQFRRGSSPIIRTTVAQLAHAAARAA